MRVVFSLLPGFLQNRIHSVYTQRFKKQRLERRLIQKLLCVNPIDISSGKTPFIASKYKRFKSHVLTISQGHYVAGGGVEKYIYEQTVELESCGVGTVLLCPVFNGDIVNNPFEGTFIAYIDGVGELVVNQSELVSLLSQFDLLKVVVHHLKNWPISVVRSILLNKQVSCLEKVFFLHDFYTICPGINRICMNKVTMKEYSCELLPGVKRCDQVWSDALLFEWSNRFETLLQSADRVIAPSYFVVEAYRKAFPDLPVKVEVQPLLSLDKLQVKPNLAFDKKIRIAFLGSLTTGKGSQLWEKLNSNPRFNSNYTFYNVGGDGGGHDHLSPSDESRYGVPIKYHFIDIGMMGPTEILKANDIDIVILWSTVPETYSFTMHEALGSGAYILTNTLSGNVHEEIAKKGSAVGKVFSSELDLYKFLYDDNRVRSTIDTNRCQYTITANFDFLYKDRAISKKATSDALELL